MELNTGTRRLGCNSQKNEVVAFFESLGYTVDWDFRGGTDPSWHEIRDEGELVCQIDSGIPLSDILEDLLCIHENRPATSKSEYTINAPDTVKFNKFLEDITGMPWPLKWSWAKHTIVNAKESHE